MQARLLRERAQKKLRAKIATTGARLAREEGENFGSLTRVDIRSRMTATGKFVTYFEYSGKLVTDERFLTAWEEHLLKHPEEAAAIEPEEVARPGEPSVTLASAGSQDPVRPTIADTARQTAAAAKAAARPARRRRTTSRPPGDTVPLPVSDVAPPSQHDAPPSPRDAAAAAPPNPTPSLPLNHIPPSPDGSAASAAGEHIPLSADDADAQAQRELTARHLTRLFELGKPYTVSVDPSTGKVRRGMRCPPTELSLIDLCHDEEEEDEPSSDYVPSS
jgi:hypothetical protein